MLLDDIEQHLADIESVSEEIREKAILALASRTDVEAIEALKKASREDEDLRLRNLARKCLLDLKKEITAVAPELFDEEDQRHLNLKKLQKSLASGDAKVRLNAVRSTVSFKEKKAVGILLAALGVEIDPVVKGSMLIAMGILGQKEVIPQLTSILKKEKDPLIRKAAIEGLSYTKDITVYLTILRIFVTDRDKLVERACLKSLNKLGKTNLLKVLERLIASSQASKREVAVRAMGRFNSSATVALLEKAVNDPEENVRQLVQRSLVRLARAGNAQAESILERLKVSKDTAQQAEDGSVILENAPAAGLDDPDPNVRLQNIQSIANAGDMLKFPQLRERLKLETHDYVKAAVVTALYRLGGRAAAPILKECLTDKVDRVRANAVECLAKFNDEANFKLFINLLKDPDGRTRANAIVALKKCAYIEPVQSIADMIESGDERLVRSAMHAIVELGSDKAVALLADLSHHDNPALKEKALESLEILRDRNNAAARKLLARIKGELKGQERRTARKTAARDDAEVEDAPPPPPPPPLAIERPQRPESPVEPPPPPRTPTAVHELPEDPPEARPEPRAQRAPERPPEPPSTRERTKAQARPPDPVPRAKDFKLPFDISHGFSFATLESIKSWLDRLPAAWRVALVALMMVWGMVFFMLIIQFIRGDDGGM